MATYFHSNNNSEIHGGGGAADGLQTLVLMNPGNYIQYSDTPPPPSHSAGNLMTFLNSTVSAATQSFSDPPPLSHGQQFVGIPLPATEHQSMQAAHHDVSAALHGYAPRGHYNLWNTVDHNSSARDATRATQGTLSLSLPAMSGDDIRLSGASSSSASGVTNNGGVSGIQSVLLSSKYLKATQELLEEVVNVNHNNVGVVKIEQHGKRSFEKVKVVGELSGAASGGEGSVGGGGDGSGKRGSEISATERQEIQIKKAKLISMLDEVEQRYRQYHSQMQAVISSFEQVAGIGSAKTYTSLALQTISKQFRCLKDAITGQIRASNKRLGEDEEQFGGGGGSRLKYVDHQLRQQRAIQQLGMMHHHHNAWRPQRGLPERSVSVLRAWLFEHFLHPYPKDSDKHMLAKQTGLTRSQVSNWFINARVRLWKPMVEEMYLEEMKDRETNNNSGSNQDDNKSSKSGKEETKGHNSETETKIFDPKQQQEEPSRNFHNTPIVSTTSPVGRNARNNSGFSFMAGSSELDGITQGNSPKKPRNDANNNEHIIKFGHDDDEIDHGKNGRDEYSFMGNQTNFIGGFGTYPIEEIGRFEAENFTPRFSGNNINNGVSLTLGLPHCDTFLPNQNIPLGRRLEMSETNDFGSMNNPNPHSQAAFENINNIQNPKRFVAQLLPDFVA